MNVAVEPSERRRGIAQNLLERLFELTANDSRRGYTLEVRVSNENAIRLYERLGFCDIPGSAAPNRAGGMSIGMALRR